MLVHMTKLVAFTEKFSFVNFPSLIEYVIAI